MKYIDPDGRNPATALKLRKLPKMYKATRALVSGSTVVAGATAYNHYLSDEEVQKAQEAFFNTVMERAAEINAQEVTSELNKNLPPDPGWVRGQEKAAEAWGEAQKITHTEMVKNNAPDGSGDNKGGNNKGGPVGAISLGVGAVIGTIMYLTNPDASKDPAEAHQEKVEEKQNQVPQDPPRNPTPLERFINWLNN